jgi:hypothetical protein
VRIERAPVGRVRRREGSHAARTGVALVLEEDRKILGDDVS